MMKPTWIPLQAALCACLSLRLLAGEPTHLDIAVPDTIDDDLFGPVKTVTNEYGYDMSDRKYKEVKTYDKQGNLVSIYKWDTRGKQIYMATNGFNAAGCMVRERVEDVRDKTTNDYQVVVNLPTRKIAYVDSITGEVEVQEYNEARYRVNTTIKKTGGKTVPLSAYDRDAANIKQRYARYEDGRLDYTVTYEYNDQGLLQRSVVVYKSEKKKNLNEYEYLKIDEHGNWTQRLLQTYDLLKGKEKIFEQFSTRTLEYYEQEPSDAQPAETP